MGGNDSSSFLAGYAFETFLQFEGVLLMVFRVAAEAISEAVNTSHNYLIIIITIFRFIHNNNRSQNPYFLNELFGVI